MPADAPPRARRDDRVAEIDRRYRRRVRAYLLRMLGDAEEVEDVTQEVFLAVHRDLHRFEGRSRLSTWILGIARRQALVHLRKRRRWVDLETAGLLDAPGGGASAERVTDAARLLVRCRRVIETELSPGLREAMERCVLEAAGMRKTAPCSDRSRDALKTSLHRSRGVLVQRVPEAGDFLDERGWTRPGLRQRGRGDPR